MVGFLPVILVPIVSGAVILLIVLMFIFVGSSGGPEAGPVGKFAAAEINAKYMLDPGIRIYRVHVEYKDGTVFLDGSVNTEEARRRAEELAYQVTVVRHVVNNIRVEKSSILQDIGSIGGVEHIKGKIEEAHHAVTSGRGSQIQVQSDSELDAAIVAEVKRIRAANADPDYDHVNVIVKDGVITLEGTVESKLLSLRARLVGSRIPGVKEVRDNIVVKESNSGPDSNSEPKS